MKTKSIIKFYFEYEGTEAMLDRLILKRAADVGFSSAERCAARVIEIIEKKRQLCRFWLHLDKVMESFSKEEQTILKDYALSRGTDKKQAHMLVTRFTRRAREGLGRVRAGLGVLKEYFGC